MCNNYVHSYSVKWPSGSAFGTLAHQALKLCQKRFVVINAITAINAKLKVMSTFFQQDGLILRGLNNGNNTLIFFN